MTPVVQFRVTAAILFSASAMFWRYPAARKLNAVVMRVASDLAVPLVDADSSMPKTHRVRPLRRGRIHSKPQGIGERLKCAVLQACIIFGPLLQPTEPPWSG
jgi:hypothetical protein